MFSTEEDEKSLLKLQLVAHKENQALNLTVGKH